jgi:Leucine-rich repeat (LRR) protein
LQLAADVLQDTPQLEVLLASNAGLQDFPAAVLACKGLRQLTLGSNSISSLPVEVTRLTRCVPGDHVKAAASHSRTASRHSTPACKGAM